MKGHDRDSPGGPVVKNPPSNAGDEGSIPGRGTKIPHAEGKLAPYAATTELAHLNKRARRKLQSPCAREPTPQLERENPHATMKDPACLSEDPKGHN